MKTENDILKSLGITTSQSSLIDTRKGVKDEGQSNSQQIRKGTGLSAREALEGQLQKGGIVISNTPMKLERVSPHADGKEPSYVEDDKKRKAKADEEYRKDSRKNHSYEGALKNNNGEEFHSDNDKQVEEMVSSAEEIDRQFDGQTRPAKLRSPYSSFGNNPDGEKEYEYKSLRTKGSLSQDELLLKALETEGEEFVAKSKKAPTAKPSKRAPHQEKDPVQAKQERQERNAAKLVKSDLDSLCDLVKGKFKEADIDPEILKNVHENSPGIVEKKNAKVNLKQKMNNKFIKSVGMGGMVFDFGHLTGNPVADNATALLNQFADPIQASNAQYQQNAYDEAIVDYTKKGDAAYNSTTTMFGNVDKGWGSQLNKPMDQQVQEAYDKGLLDEKGGPAVINKFNKSEIKLGGIDIKATSETDAALIEMMKAEQANQRNDTGGFVADASSGGKVNVIAGLPLESQLPPHMLNK